MKFRTLASVFFLLYGGLIPVFATAFVAENLVASVAMMACCGVLALLLWSGRATLMNIIISAYVLRVYLTRPYVNMFVGNLDSIQRRYIDGNNYFFNSTDAAVVYMSLLSLLVAWFAGLHAVPPRQDRHSPPPWIFRRVDEVVVSARWPFWLAWVILTALNYVAPTTNWQGIATGEGVPLFALGLFSTTTIGIVCLYAFIRSRQANTKHASLLLLFPVLFSAVSGTAGGSRGAIFSGVSLALTYWMFLNSTRRFEHRDLSKIAIVASILPILLFGSLLAQSLRPLLRSASDAEVIWTATLSGLDIADPNNPVINTFYFGLTEFLHRMSSLQAQFLILNDHWIHDPWETFNPLYIFMRTINSLLPSGIKPFEQLLTINQLFDYIYLDQIVNYSSTMWSIQGSLYLIFGFWLSPAVVFLIARLITRHDRRFEFLARTSPSFATLLVVVFQIAIENGTFEYVISSEVVRPITSFLALIVLCRTLRFLSPVKRRSPLADVSAPRLS